MDVRFRVNDGPVVLLRSFSRQFMLYIPLSAGQAGGVSRRWPGPPVRVSTPPVRNALQLGHGGVWTHGPGLFGNLVRLPGKGRSSASRWGGWGAQECFVRECPGGGPGRRSWEWALYSHSSRVSDKGFSDAGGVCILCVGAKQRGFACLVNSALPKFGESS